MKVSRSPSPSRSAKAGLLLYPTSARPKGLAEAAAKAGAALLPVFWKKKVVPESSPMKASRSPSPSRSAKPGLLRDPTSARPKGLAEAAAKAGGGAVPGVGGEKAGG